MEVTRGSAVIEGIALASRRWRVAAVREPDGTIFVATGEEPNAKAKAIPFVRSLFMWFLESPSELLWAGNTPHTEALPPNVRKNPISVLMTGVTTHGLPLLALYFLARSLGPASWAVQAIIYAVQITVFAIYMLLIRRIGGVSRVFQYAGAFKMAHWQAEAASSSLRDHPRWHWRGTTISMALVLALTSLGAGLVLPHLPASWLVALGVRIALTIVAVPLADELQRALTKLGHGTIMRVLFAPLIAVDLLATLEPDDGMLEVAQVCLAKLRALES